ncbi:unnamed protein product, partial [Prorocentrum cordatum]
KDEAEEAQLLCSGPFYRPLLGHGREFRPFCRLRAGGWKGAPSHGYAPGPHGTMQGGMRGGPPGPRGGPL